MKLQTILLGCGAALCLAGPAIAGVGMYVGLGAGWDGQSNINVTQFAPPPATGNLTTDDGLIIAGTLGYKLPVIPIRLEFESGYDWHKISTFNTGGASYGAGGHANIASELFNAIYDFPITPGWNLYGGAGLGVGHVWFAPYVAATHDQIAFTDKWGFMWQAIAGTSFEIAPDADIFVDYRYRDATAQATTDTPAFGPVASHSIHENVVMAGVRFYMFPPVVEEAPPPAPAYYAPPPETSPPAMEQQQNTQQNMAPGSSGGASSGGAGGGGPQ
ncbi:MAG TPA: outer membrane beta-barrel protein [Rhizomicrobium sp.]|jgi:opacity protein-like surface antigen|nr:outer membrane beta-barrel protein [Rhizomicrobium sp.]